MEPLSQWFVNEFFSCVWLTPFASAIAFPPVCRIAVSTVTLGKRESHCSLILIFCILTEGGHFHLVLGYQSSLFCSCALPIFLFAFLSLIDCMNSSVIYIENIFSGLFAFDFKILYFYGAISLSLSLCNSYIQCHTFLNPKIYFLKSCVEYCLLVILRFPFYI